jgi:hypothetical protein
MCGDPNIFAFWKPFQGRRAAIRLLRPFIARTRALSGPISEYYWTDAYVSGFLTTLITIVAKDAVGRISDNALGLVQMEAWAELVGAPWELVGERMLLLSLNDDADFAEGCGAAIVFGRALLTSSRGHGFARIGDIVSVLNAQPNVASCQEHDLLEMWDRNIGRRPASPSA